MKLRALCLGLVYIVIFGAAAWAEDWKVSRIDGQVSLFRQGSWTKLALGDVVPGDSQLRTFADGSLTAIRGHESLKLAPKSQVQIQERNSPRATLIRQIAGGLSVESAGAETPLTVQTQFMSALLKDGAMVSLVDPAATYLAMRRGSAEITDIAHNKKSVLSEGKGAKINPVRGVVTAATNDPALVSVAAAMAALEGVAVEAPAAKGFDAPPRGERKLSLIHI